MKTKEITQEIAKYISANIGSYTIPAHVYPTNPNGTKPSHWKRRAKMSVLDVTYRLFECEGGKLMNCGDYIMAVEYQDKIVDIMWLTKHEALTKGFTIMNSLGDSIKLVDGKLLYTDSWGVSVCPYAKER